MPGCIDSFDPELSGWFFVAQPEAESGSGNSPTLLLTLNGQTLLAFQPRLHRPDVDQAHGRSCGAVGFRLPLSNLLTRYRHEASAAGLSLDLEVICPNHPKERIDNSRVRLVGQPKSAPSENRAGANACAHFYSVNFFDPGGNTVYSGGAERYIVDLADVLRENFGLRSVVYQAAHYAWQRSYRGLQVIGLPCIDQSYRSISRAFLRTPAAAVHLYSPVALACAGAHHPAIGISHGAYWDTESTALGRHDTIRADLLDGLEHVDHVVSVDANSLTSLQAHRGLIPLAQLERIDRKTSIVLNYADASFTAAPERSFEFSAANPCRVLYARRLYAPRGFDLVVQAAPELFRSCPHLQLTFCGGAEPEAREPLLNLQKRFPDQITQRELLPEQMPQVYADQHLSLVPTVNSEGSSLSALESMASGCVVVASYTGGLANIVVDGFNGVLIPPTASALVAAVKELYSNPARCTNLSERGRQVASTLNLQTWRQRWKDCLETLEPRIEQRSTPAPPTRTSISIFHPLVEGVGLGQGSAGLLPPQRPQALFQLLERMGLPTRFCAADHLLNSGEQICSRNYTCYDDVSLVYIYKPLLYAFLVPELQQQLPKTFQAHSDLIGRRLYGLTTTEYTPWHYLQDQADRIRASQTILWFDWLDAPELEWPGLPVEASAQEQAEHALLGRYVTTIYEQFMRDAAVFTTSSSALQRRAETQVKRRPALIPNATVSRYSPVLSKPTAPPAALKAALKATDSYRWRLVYWGTADPRVLDLELITSLAARCPAAAFLLVGSGPWPSERMPTNMIILPQLAQADLLTLAQHCQVGLLPFRDNNITQAVDPLKLHEYLEAGLPVLASDTAHWRELRASYGWQIPMRLCNELTDWLQAIAQTLEAGPSTGTRGRFWSDQASNLSKLLLQALPPKATRSQQLPFVRLEPQGFAITAPPESHHSRAKSSNILISESNPHPSCSELEIILHSHKNEDLETGQQLQLPLHVSTSQETTLTISVHAHGITHIDWRLLDSQGNTLTPVNTYSLLGSTTRTWPRLKETTDTLSLLLRTSAHATPSCTEPQAQHPPRNPIARHIRITANLEIPQTSAPNSH